MSFLNSIFLWTALSLTIPILIALWNRRRHRQERFGAYYLLKKAIESTRRRIQLLEFLKLLNRLILLGLLILVFAEPLQKTVRLAGAKEGFVLILDTSRVMQAGNLIEQQDRAVRRVLSRIPGDIHGAIMYASDFCLVEDFETNRYTASASDWLSRWGIHRVPYSGRALSSSGLSSCISRASSLFSDREILKIFFSPLPSSIENKILEGLQVEKLQPPQMENPVKLKLELATDLDKVKLLLTTSDDEVQLALINLHGNVEQIGKVKESLDFVPAQKSWIWVQQSDEQDPWLGHQILTLKNFQVSKISLWAQKETQGYLSLLTALRNHPNIEVSRQIGGEVLGSHVIIYGNFPYPLPASKYLWFFLSPNVESPFHIRDQKQWSPQSSSLDIRRAFEMSSEEGNIFIRHYNLLALDGLRVLETFNDGAPALLQYENSEQRVWITPFDLEDLSTDFSLEPTFIPYLYRRLDRWLQSQTELSSGQPAELIWAMPGKMRPRSEVLQLLKWPGIYKSGDRYEVVEPMEFPDSFLQWESNVQESQIEEDVSLRPRIYKLMIGSLFIELLLCVFSLRFMLALVILCCGFFGNLNLQAAQPVQRIGISMIASMDNDRQEALKQIVQEVSFLSNLEFFLPQSQSPQDFWSSAAIVHSSTQAWTGFKAQERELVRDYLERGGLLIFDDPLAVKASSFYQSVVREMEKILPGRPFKEIPRDNVLFKTFYLLSEVSGRRLASASIEGIELDGRWVAVFSFNDLLGANLRSSNGDYKFSVSPYGVMQRTLSKRLFLNLLMYSVTLDYKDDAIHLPHILKRRVR